MSNPSLRGIGAALCILAALMFTATGADAAGCNVRAGGCSGTVSFSIYNPPPGEPTHPCLQGHPLYKLTISLACLPGGFVNETAIVCSASTESVTIQANGHTLIFAPDNGYVWSDVKNDCGLLTVKVD